VLRLIGDLLIYWATAVGALSVIWHARVPWRSTPMGRHLMAYMGSIAAVFLLISIRNVFGDSHWFEILRVVVFVAVPVTMTWRFWLQVKARRLDRGESGG
jgi:hypothetical protein